MKKKTKEEKALAIVKQLHRMWWEDEFEVAQPHSNGFTISACALADLTYDAGDEETTLGELVREVIAEEAEEEVPDPCQCGCHAVDKGAAIIDGEPCCDCWVAEIVLTEVKVK